MSNSENKRCDSGSPISVDDAKIVFMADKVHRSRCFAKELFALASEKTKDLTFGCTTINAEQTKRRLSLSSGVRTKDTYMLPSSNSISCAGEQFDLP
jgi:hypothetical protein